jgi:hypothetical protein
MLPIAMYDIVRAENENKLREAERIHKVSWTVEHSRPHSVLKRLQNLLARG